MCSCHGLGYDESKSEMKTKWGTGISTQRLEFVISNLSAPEYELTASLSTTKRSAIKRPRAMMLGGVVEKVLKPEDIRLLFHPLLQLHHQ